MVIRRSEIKMYVIDVPYRTANSPNLNVRETNVILRFLRNMYDWGIRSRAQEGDLQVTFNDDFDQYSVFTIEQSTATPDRVRPSVYAKKIFNYETHPNSKGTIFVTNGPNPVTAGSNWGCWVIGYERPHLVRLFDQSTIHVGDRLYLKRGENYVVKNPGGHFIAVSEEIVISGSDKLIWAVRHERQILLEGKTTAALAYGNSGTMNIWRNGVVSNPLETATAYFTWIGKTGDEIPSGTKIKVEWDDNITPSVYNGGGGYKVANSNCEAS